MTIIGQTRQMKNQITTNVLLVYWANQNKEGGSCLYGLKMWTCLQDQAMLIAVGILKMWTDLSGKIADPKKHVGIAQETQIHPRKQELWLQVLLQCQSGYAKHKTMPHQFQVKY